MASTATTNYIPKRPKANKMLHERKAQQFDTLRVFIYGTRWDPSRHASMYDMECRFEQAHGVHPVPNVGSFRL